MNINLNYTYTQKQLKNAHRFMIFPTLMAKPFFWLVTLSVFSVTAFVWFIAEPAKMSAMLHNSCKIILMICSVVWFLMFCVVALNYYFTPVYLFKKSPFHRGNFLVKLTDENMICKQEILEENTKSENEGIVNWNNFDKKSENSEFIILFRKRKNCILPKESFRTKAELEEFRLFLSLQRHIKPKKFNGKKLWG